MLPSGRRKRWKYTRDSRRYVTPRIPLAYASLLVIALVAVIGFAAFSPSVAPVTDEPDVTTTVAVTPAASARVASAVLALRVADSETRVATTQSPATTNPPEAAFTSEEAVTTTETPLVETTSPTTTTTQPRDTTAPPIKVTSHSDGEHVTSSYVVFKGTSEAGATVRSGPFDADVAENGDWSLGLVMIDGANRAIFTAVDKAGNSSDVKIAIHYDKPKVTTTTKAPASTTTSPPAQTNWSPLWPADAGGKRDVEAWRPLVEKYWDADKVDCVLGLIRLESRGDPRAYNPRSGAEGLMQHLSKYWKPRAASAGFRDSNGLYATPYNAEANIAAGALIARGANPWFKPWRRLVAYGSCDPVDPIW